jgi:hypothetical protein
MKHAVFLALVSPIFARNATMITDHRESAAYGVQRDVETAREFPLPKVGECLLDKACRETSELDKRNEKILEEIPSTSKGNNQGTASCQGNWESLTTR